MLLELFCSLLFERIWIHISYVQQLCSITLAGDTLQVKLFLNHNLHKSIFLPFTRLTHFQYTLFLSKKIQVPPPPVLLLLNLLPIILCVSFPSSNAALIIILLLLSSSGSVSRHILSPSASFPLLVPSPVLPVSCLLCTNLVEHVISLSLLTVLSCLTNPGFPDGRFFHSCFAV